MELVNVEAEECHRIVWIREANWFGFTIFNYLLTILIFFKAYLQRSVSILDIGFTEEFLPSLLDVGFGV